MTELQLQEAILKNALEIQRLISGQQDQVDEIFKELAADLRRLLTSGAIEAGKKREIEAIIKQAEEIITLGYQRMNASFDAHGLAVVVAERTQEIIEDVIPSVVRLPSDALLMQLGSQALLDGTVMRDKWLKLASTLGDAQWGQFQAAVNIGMANGETQQQIVARVLGDTGILQIARRDAMPLVHTSVMTVANKARLETFKRNSRIIKGVRWLATLDRHVCENCSPMDGQAWNLDGEKLKGTIYDFRAPPIHYNDRCVLSPIPKTFKEIGLDIPEPEAEGQRASSLGPVNGSMTAEQFLKNLSDEYVDGTFTKRRADKWRAGGAKASDFINSKAVPLTLDELRKR